MPTTPWGQVPVVTVPVFIPVTVRSDKNDNHENQDGGFHDEPKLFKSFEEMQRYQLSATT